MGSRILSRSFTVEDVEDDGDAASEHGSHAHAHEHSDDATEPLSVPTLAAAAPSNSGDVSMEDVRSDRAPPGDEKDEDEDEGEESEDEAESATTMVPIADMLNARTGSNNVRISLSLCPSASSSYITSHFSSAGPSFPRNQLPAHGRHRSYPRRRTDLEHLR